MEEEFQLRSGGWVEVSQMKGFFSDNTEKCFHSRFPCSRWEWNSLCSYWQLGSSFMKFASSCPFSFFQWVVFCLLIWRSFAFPREVSIHLALRVVFSRWACMWVGTEWWLHCMEQSELVASKNAGLLGSVWDQVGGMCWVCVGPVLSATLDYRSQGLYWREIKVSYSEPSTALASIVSGKILAGILPMELLKHLLPVFHQGGSYISGR